MIRTWIEKSHKVTKALVVESVLFVSVITCVIVMTRKVVLIHSLVVMKDRVRIMSICISRIIGLEDYLMCK